MYSSTGYLPLLEDETGKPMTQAEHRKDRPAQKVIPPLAKQSVEGGTPGGGVQQAPASYAQVPQYRLDTPETTGGGATMMAMEQAPSAMAPRQTRQVHPTQSSGYGGYGATSPYANGYAQPPTYGGQRGQTSQMVAQGFQQGGDTAMSSGNKYAMIAGAVSKAVGTIISINAAAKAEKQAREEYEFLMDEWKKAKRREEADRAREIERQRQQDIQYSGAQSAALEDRFATSYGGYVAGGQ